MEKCPKTMEGLFQSSRVIRIAALHFTIRTCMQNFSQFLRVQSEKSLRLELEVRVSFLWLSRQGPYPADYMRLFGAVTRDHQDPAVLKQETRLIVPLSPDVQMNIDNPSRAEEISQNYLRSDASSVDKSENSTHFSFIILRWIFVFKFNAFNAK